MRLFRRKKKEKTAPTIMDLNGEILEPGDIVESKRYELGDCEVILEGLQYFYVSKDGSQKISYTRMIDAITGNQKVVKKVE